MGRLEDGLRLGWLSLLTQRVGDVMQPGDLPRVHASGPEPYRVLLLGGGIAIGLGMSRHERALPGHLARHLASITGRGVDLDITARLGMTVTEARTEIDQRDLLPFDAIVLTLGISDALTALPTPEWRERLELLLAVLLSSTSPNARIVLIGAHSSHWSAYLNPLVTRLPGRRLEEFNHISRELAWTLPRTSYLAPVTKHSPETTQYSVLDYERVGRAVAGHLAQRLARESPAPRPGPTPEAAPNTMLSNLRLLGSTPDAEIDRIVARTRAAFGVEGAWLAVLGHSEVWPKSTAGPVAQIPAPRLGSVAAATAIERGGLAVRNLREDPRFRNNPLARRHGMAFYAGYPVRSPGSACVAVLTIFDPRPRSFSEQEMTVLRNHALLIQDTLAHRSSYPAPPSDPRREAATPDGSTRISTPPAPSVRPA